MGGERESESYLGKVLLRYPLCPHLAGHPGPGGVADVCTLDQHPLDDGRVHGGPVSEPHT